MIVFGRFLRILLSCHVKPNTDPYSVIQDSTLDTPQGGVLEKFLSLPSEGGGGGGQGVSHLRESNPHLPTVYVLET